jgi:hypothetical protein
MKVIKINVDGQIKIKSIYDTDNNVTENVNTSLKVPYRKL